MFPSLMQFEARSQTIWLCIAIGLLVGTLVSIVWQWKRGPRAGVACFWGIVFAISLWGISSNSRTSLQLVSWPAHILLLLSIFTMLAGLIRNVVRRSVADIIAGLSMAVILGYLMIPSLGHSPEASWRSQCKNNLKRIGLGVYNLSDMERFTPASGQPAVSWRVTILPWLDVKDLAQGYSPAQAWDSMENREVGERDPRPFRCPSHVELTRHGPWACADYALLTGPGTIFPTSDSAFDSMSIPDGTANTILVVECPGQKIPWTEPRDVQITDVTMDVNRLGKDGTSPSVASSYHPTHQAHVLFGDGSVRMLSADISPDTLRSLSTANGNDDVGDF